MSAFGIGTNTQGTNAGKIRGSQIDIACDCWFMSTGKSIPRIIKFIDENGELQTINKIHVKCMEIKNYSGIQSIEYECSIISQGLMHDVKLIFFNENCKWIMTFL